jgi:hypothetical protein
MNNNWENIQTSINHQTYLPSLSHRVVFSFRKQLLLFFNNPHHPSPKSPVIALPLYRYAFWQLQETVVTVSCHIHRQLACLFVMLI